MVIAIFWSSPLFDRKMQQLKVPGALRIAKDFGTNFPIIGGKRVDRRNPSAQIFLHFGKKTTFKCFENIYCVEIIACKTSVTH